MRPTTYQTDPTCQNSMKKVQLTLINSLQMGQDSGTFEVRWINQQTKVNEMNFINQDDGIQVATTQRRMYLRLGQCEARVNLRPNEDGEYVVTFYYDGKLMADSSYHTDDGADAEGTARATLRFLTSK